MESNAVESVEQLVAVDAEARAQASRLLASRGR